MTVPLGRLLLASVSCAPRSSKSGFSPAPSVHPAPASLLEQYAASVNSVVLDGSDHSSGVAVLIFGVAASSTAPVLTAAIANIVAPES